MVTDSNRDGSSITELLSAWQSGDAGARSRLVEILYADLRRLASRMMAAERAGHTLDPTALVHEAYLRLAGIDHIAADNRAHFVALAARVMRQVLVDHARARGAAKRGGNAARLTLSAASDVARPPELDVVDLDRALDELEAIDPERCRLVELRWLAGLTTDEAAAVLGMSPRTVNRRWRSTRAWLEQRLAGGTNQEHAP